MLKFFSNARYVIAHRLLLYIEVEVYIEQYTVTHHWSCAIHVVRDSVLNLILCPMNLVKKHRILIRAHQHQRLVSYGIVATRWPPNCPSTDELYRSRVAATTMAVHCHSIWREVRQPTSRTAMLWSTILATMDQPANALRCIQIHGYWCRCHCPATNRIV